MANSYQTSQALIHLLAEIQKIEGPRIGQIRIHESAERAIEYPITLKCDNETEGTTTSINPVLSAEHNSLATGTAGKAAYYQTQINSDPTDFSVPRWDSGETELSPNIDEGGSAFATSSCNFGSSDDEETFWFRWRFKDTDGNWGNWGFSFFTYSLGTGAEAPSVLETVAITKQELLNQHRFSSIVNDQKAIQTNSTLIISANAARKFACIINDSDTIIFLSLGETAVQNRGIRLGTENKERRFKLDWANLYCGDINGIHANSGTKLVSYSEGE